MAESKPKFPASDDGDPEDVVVALETANALWGRNDSGEAIRWLRRAAEAAEEAGNDMRALSLARTAADLTTQLEQEDAAAAAKATPSRPGSPPAAKPAAALTPPSKSEKKPAASPPAAAPAPAKKETPSPAPPAPSEPKSTPAAPPPPPPPPSAPSSPGKESTIERISRKAAADASKAEARSGAEKAKDAMAHLATLASADATTGTPSTRRSLGPYQALRVSVEPSKDDRKLLMVRVLNQSEEPAPNAHEAMLVSISPNIDVRSRKR